jgi:hypothetical protein
MEKIPVIPHDDWVDLELYHNDAAKSAPAFPAYTFEE